MSVGTSAGKVVLKFSLDSRPGSPFTGTIERPGRGVSTLVGKWAKLYDTDKDRVLGLWLDCLIDEVDPMSLTIPMHETFGGGYRGRDESGTVFFSKNTNPRPGGF